VFTGIVEELGEVVRLETGAASARLTVRGPLVSSDAVPGGSIAVNGVCLTVTGLGGSDPDDDPDGDPTTRDTFTADIMLETLRRTALGGLAPGDPVNLERPLPAAGRLGGHLVQGHVDGLGTILERSTGDNWDVVRIALPSRLARYVAEKGSIAVDGVSLTVVAVGDGDPGGESWFSVSLIPATLAGTTLGRRPAGERVNLEVDVLAKYTERLLGAAPAGAGVRP